MMVTFKKTLTILILLLALSVPAGQCETLSIGVSHSEYLPPVPVLQQRVALPEHYQRPALNTETMVMTPQQAPLQAEAQAQAAVSKPAPAPVSAAVRAPATLQQPVIEWFPIPTPMAGVWTKRGDLTTSVTDLRTGLSEALSQWTDDEMTVTWGHQTDKNGDIWHANVLPAERDSESNGKAVKFLTVGQKLEGKGADALITRTHYVVSESYGRGGPVSDVFQQEALNHYQVLAESELSNNSTNRVFTYQGTAIRDGVLQTKFARVAAFAPTQNLAGIDLVQSLNDYLRVSGHPELMR